MHAGPPFYDGILRLVVFASLQTILVLEELGQELVDVESKLSACCQGIFTITPALEVG